MRPEETIDFHVRWAWQKMTNIYNKEASELGGSMSLGFILLNIEKEGTPSTSLGPKMGMRSTSLARSLQALEKEGLIVRKMDSEDKRKVLVFLTAEGKKYRDRSKEMVLKMNQHLLGNIDQEKLKIFFEVMSELNEVLDNTCDLKNINEKTH